MRSNWIMSDPNSIRFLDRGLILDEYLFDIAGERNSCLQ